MNRSKPAVCCLAEQIARSGIACGLMMSIGDGAELTRETSGGTSYAYRSLRQIASERLNGVQKVVRSNRTAPTNFLTYPDLFETNSRASKHLR